MTPKEIRSFLKAGRKVTFNRHIYGTMSSFERLSVVAVREQKGQTFVKFITTYGSCKPAWGLVQPDLDDYVSVEVAPHGSCSKCSASFSRIEARDNSHQCGVAPQEEN